MDWNQIESKWAAMTLRVRADWNSAGGADGTSAIGQVSERRRARPGLPEAAVLDQTALVLPLRSNLSAE